ncbi:MAG: site-2 protease family protein, partial [Candidatus Hermodarchaeota archaeon]
EVRNIKIAKIYGIEIKLHFSTLLIIGLVGFYSINFYLSIIPNAPLIELIFVGLLNGIILLISVLIHELSHSIVAQRYGLRVTEIELYLFGGVSKIEEEPRTPKSEMIISIVGPLSSFLIGVGLLSLLFLPINLPLIISVTLMYSGISNIVLSVFNLLPAFPIDGGRILRAFLWKRKNDILSATKIASKVGLFIGYGLIFYGFFQSFVFSLFSGIWLIMMGIFLNSSTRQSYIQTKNEVILSKVNIKKMLTISNLEIPFSIPLDLAFIEYFIRYRKSYFPVIKGEDIIGIIHIDDITRIPVLQRPNYIVGDIMRNVSDFPSIDDNKSGKEALKNLRLMGNIPHIIAVKNKDTQELIGFLGEEELISFLNFWNLKTHNS